MNNYVWDRTAFCKSQVSKHVMIRILKWLAEIFQPYDTSFPGTGYSYTITKQEPKQTKDKTQTKQNPKPKPVEMWWF